MHTVGEGNLSAHLLRFCLVHHRCFLSLSLWERVAIAARAKVALAQRPVSKGRQVRISTEECKSMLCCSPRALPGSKRFQLGTSCFFGCALAIGSSVSLLLKTLSGAFSVRSKRSFQEWLVGWLVGFQPLATLPLLNFRKRMVFYFKLKKYLKALFGNGFVKT